MINDYEATTPMTTDAVPVENSTIENRTIENDDVISLLNGLIQTCEDGSEGFKTAAENISDGNLKTLFFELNQQRAQFSAELQALVRSLGGDPEHSGSFSGALHRGWMDLKTAITGNDEQAILNECERGEDSAKSNYKDALGNNLPGHIQDVVQEQYTAVRAAHDRIKALRDSESHTGSNTARTGY